VGVEEAGWEELFSHSVEIMTELEPTDVPRTWCYLAHGYLRSGRLHEAEEVLRQIERHAGLDELTRRFFCFHQANAARCRGELWTDPDMERIGVSRQLAHPFGYYWQATARQRGRDPADAARRFSQARTFLTQDLPNADELNIRRFLIDCIRLAEAGWTSDQRGWDEALTVLRQHLAPQPGFELSAHYADYLPPLGSAPSQGAAERLLTRVPFFSRPASLTG
jgi:pentatricopeptide repeat protein